MDLTSIVEDTERTPFCPQTDRQTDGRTTWNQYTPPFNFVEGLGIITFRAFKACVLLWFEVSCFTHIIEGYFIATLGILSLTQCQWSSLKEYSLTSQLFGIISQYVESQSTWLCVHIVGYRLYDSSSATWTTYCKLMLLLFILQIYITTLHLKVYKMSVVVFEKTLLKLLRHCKVFSQDHFVAPEYHTPNRLSNITAGLGSIWCIYSYTQGMRIDS